jgi:hypothetical protein
LEKKEIRISTTDPDSWYMVREGKPEGFFYLDHRTVDGKYNFITDVFVTPGNVHDSIPYLKCLNRQIHRFDFLVEEVALDAGYLTMPICQELMKRNIFAVIAHRRFRPKKGLFINGNLNTYLNKMYIFALPGMNSPIQLPIAQDTANTSKSKCVSELSLSLPLYSLQNLSKSCDSPRVGKCQRMGSKKPFE